VRLQLVISKEGESISDELRTSLTQIPSFPTTHTEEVQLDKILTFKDETVNDIPLEFRTLKQWTPDEDKILIEKVQTLGPKWTIISKLFEDRSPSSLRLRYHYLYKH